MKITIGIDPGNIESAMSIYDGTRIVFCQKIPNKTDSDVEWDFFDTFKHQYILAHKEFSMGGLVEKVFIETIQSYGMPVGQEVFETCFYIGRLQLLLEQNNIPYEMVKRSDIKLHHCGTTRAKDTNIKAALIERFGDKGTKSAPGFFFGVTGDGWSACAIAIHGHDKLNGR